MKKKEGEGGLSVNEEASGNARKKRRRSAKYQPNPNLLSLSPLFSLPFISHTPFLLPSLHQSPSFSDLQRVVDVETEFCSGAMQTIFTLTSQLGEGMRVSSSTQSPMSKKRKRRSVEEEWREKDDISASEEEEDTANEDEDDEEMEQSQFPVTFTAAQQEMANTGVFVSLSLLSKLPQSQQLKSQASFLLAFFAQSKPS